MRKNTKEQAREMIRTMVEEMLSDASKYGAPSAEGPANSIVERLSTAGLLNRMPTEREWERVFIQNCGVEEIDPTIATVWQSAYRYLTGRDE